MEKIDFIATDGIKLNGFLYKSNKNTKDVILAVHGMSSNCFKNRDEIIAKEANKAKIDYFCFNNRGSELVKYIRKEIDGKKEKILGGTTYEDVLEGYEDITGAIIKLKELGYENIFLQGHSLGCTKIVYTYNELKNEESDELLNNIKGIILLSLIDIPETLKFYLKNKYEEYIEFAQNKIDNGQVCALMPTDAFIHPISVKTFLRYARDNEEINFANYSGDNDFKKLNNIDKPLFMRWGNDNEMILQKADELVEIMNKKIQNSQKDIGIVDGANHGYSDKEEIVAKQIVKFIETCIDFFAI